MDDKFPFYADENSDPCLSAEPAMAVKCSMGPLNQTIKIEKTQLGSTDIEFLLKFK